MKHLTSFLRHHKSWFTLAAMLMAVQTFFLFLLDAPANDIIYSILISLFVVLLCVTAAFTKYCQKLSQLQAMSNDAIANTLTMPKTTDEREQLYQQMLSQLNNERRRTLSKLSQQQAEMNTYYTMWVHQIKTPIAAMQLFLQVQKDEILNETTDFSEITLDDYLSERRQTQLAHISSIEEELFRIDQYAGMALQYQRTLSMQNDLLIQQIPLDRIIKDVIHKYARILVRKRLSMQYEGTDLEVLTDEKWLFFILEQIISNAVKYTPTGGIRIEVARAGKWCDLTVSDTGIGIQPEDLNRIFERGYTGYNGHADKHSTGIGLYLCHQMADRLGHTLHVTSEVAAGTTVHIGISLQKATNQTD